MAVSPSSLLVLFCWCLLQTQDCTGQSLVGSPLPVLASVGDDVVLPCFFLPPEDVSGLTLEWSRPDLRPKVVFVWQSFRELRDVKNPQFVGRTFLFEDQLKKGNISLRLMNVKPEDTGSYRCFVLNGEETFVKLIIGSSSPAVVSVSAVHVWSPAVELQCESGAWYPQPELQWLDSEERPLSADHTLPLPGPDGLFNISSRLTVEHSGSFTCSLSQSSTNSTRQDTVRLTDDFFQAKILPVVVVLVLGLTVFAGLAVISSVLYYRAVQHHENPERQEGIPPGDHNDSSQTRIAELEQKINRLNDDCKNLQTEKDTLQTNVDRLGSHCELLKKLHENRRLKELSEKESVMINDFNKWGTSFILINNSHEVQMEGWLVMIEVDITTRLVYRFEGDFVLRTGDTVTIWAKGFRPAGGDVCRDREWEMPPWNSGETALVSLYNTNGELVDRISEWMHAERPNTPPWLQ